jgi:hypothetical protein
MVGIPYEHLGEVPALFVVPRADQNTEIDLLLAYCRSNASVHADPWSYGECRVICPGRGERGSHGAVGNAIAATPCLL